MEMKKNKKNEYFLRLFWIFIIGSLVGFIYENILVLFQKGHFELRQGLLYGPLIPVYGAGAVIYEILVPKMKNYVQVFFYTMFLGGVTEYVFSYLQEVLFGTISWDYHWLRLNLNGRTSLLHSCYWGMAGVIFYKIIHPWFDSLMNRNITKQIMIMSAIVATLVSADIIVSWAAAFRQMERVMNIPEKTKVDMVLDKYYPDERIDKIFTNKIVKINR